MQYKITKVSEQAPREWSNPDKPEHGTTYYIKVLLDGHVKPVEIGKKKADALKVGDTVNGTIIESPEHPTDRFKSEFAGGGGFTDADRAKLDEILAILKADTQASKEVKDEVIEDIGDEPINLDDIPF